MPAEDLIHLLIDEHDAVVELFEFAALLRNRSFRRTSRRSVKVIEDRQHLRREIADLVDECAAPLAVHSVFDSSQNPLAGGRSFPECRCVRHEARRGVRSASRSPARARRSAFCARRDEHSPGRPGGLTRLTSELVSLTKSGAMSSSTSESSISIFRSAVMCRSFSFSSSSLIKSSTDDSRFGVELVERVFGLWDLIFGIHLFASRRNADGRTAVRGLVF